MMCGALGGTSIIMESFDAEEFLRLVEKHKVTQSTSRPCSCGCSKLPEYDTSTLKGAVHAAAPCPADVKAKMIDWWGPILIEYYAGSEGNGVTVSDSKQWLAHRGTVGRAVVGEIKILDDDGTELPVGETGTVYFAGGPQFAYHNDKRQDRARLHDRGWSTLGDVGYLDAEGFLYLTDRKAYMIISGGVNIYPQETEDTDLASRRGGCRGVRCSERGNGRRGQGRGAAATCVARGQGPRSRTDRLLPQASLADQMPQSVDFRSNCRARRPALVKRHLRDKYWAKMKKSPAQA